MVSMQELRLPVEALVGFHSKLQHLRKDLVARSRYVTTVAVRILVTLHGTMGSTVLSSEILESDLAKMLSRAGTMRIDKVDPFSPRDAAALSAQFDAISDGKQFITELDVEIAHQRWLRDFHNKDATHQPAFIVPLPIVKRAMQGHARRLASGVPGVFNYEDWLVFELAQRDAMTDSSLPYWHKLLDLDDDGHIGVRDICRVWKDMLSELVTLEGNTAKEHDTPESAAQRVFARMRVRRSAIRGVLARAALPKPVPVGALAAPPWGADEQLAAAELRRHPGLEDTGGADGRHPPAAVGPQTAAISPLMQGGRQSILLSGAKSVRGIGAAERGSTMFEEEDDEGVEPKRGDATAGLAQRFGAGAANAVAAASPASLGRARTVGSGLLDHSLTASLARPLTSPRHAPHSVTEVVSDSIWFTRQERARSRQAAREAAFGPTLQPPAIHQPSSIAKCISTRFLRRSEFGYELFCILLLVNKAFLRDPAVYEAQPLAKLKRRGINQRPAPEMFERAPGSAGVPATARSRPRKLFVDRSGTPRPERRSSSRSLDATAAPLPSPKAGAAAAAASAAGAAAFGTGLTAESSTACDSEVEDDLGERNAVDPYASHRRGNRGTTGRFRADSDSDAGASDSESVASPPSAAPRSRLPPTSVHHRAQAPSRQRASRADRAAAASDSRH
jgi:hypothetical protein